MKCIQNFICLSKENADIINETKEKGERVISVGTTSTRTLETIADENGIVKRTVWMDKYIYLSRI